MWMLRSIYEWIDATVKEDGRRGINDSSPFVVHEEDDEIWRQAQKESTDDIEEVLSDLKMSFGDLLTG